MARYNSSHKRVLDALYSSEEVAYPGISEPGQLTYQQVSKLTKITVSNLLIPMQAQYRNGLLNKDSLEFNGLIISTRLEGYTPAGRLIQTKILWSITDKGRKFIERWNAHTEDENDVEKPVQEKPARGKVLLVYSRALTP